MFNIEELKFIKNILEKSEVQDEMTLTCIEKLKNEIPKYETCKDSLWNFYWNCRYGGVGGIFKATKEEVEAATGKQATFGEILGKHSDVDGIIEDGEITLISDDPVIVVNSNEYGYNPLEYIME